MCTFNYWLEAAKAYLSGPLRDRAAHARWCVRQALAEANRMRDRKRAALCLKILNWLRADLARLAA